MPKRISKPAKKARLRDSNQIAHATIQRTIELSESEQDLDKATISLVMSALGRKGGKIGGKRRMETMTAEERSHRALAAAKARWQQKKEIKKPT
jgi:hypothetical protein